MALVAPALSSDVFMMVMQAQSTPHMEKANAARDIDSVSPVVFAGPETGALFEASRGEAVAAGASSSMATSSSGESVELSQLYQDICDQKDVNAQTPLPR